MQSYLAQREELLRAAAPGLGSARQLSDLTDEAVRELARAASSHPTSRWAVVALGGWGAGGLLPASDIDILVLTENAAQARGFVEQILYPLWDAGLTVGHQVRTPRDQLRAMSEDLASLTATLTARGIAGDTVWADTVLDSAVGTATRNERRTLRTLSDRARPGSPYLLEPDLKDGRGGRRDWDELVWCAAALQGRRCRDPEPLARHGVLGAQDLAALRAHAETLAATRWELQLAGFGDRMSLESVEVITVDPEDVQRALAETALALSRVRRTLSARPSSRTGAAPAGEAEASLSGPAVLNAVRSGQDTWEGIAESAQAGRLDDLLPGFRALMTTRRPGLGHQLTVGAHCLKTASLVRGVPDIGGEAAAASYASLTRPDALLVAAIAHDVGKREAGPGHAERGASECADAARRFGLSEEDALHAGELVRLHLVLAETAFTADLDDEDAILRAAAVIRERELLAPLHVLTVADSLATGTATWTPWRAALLASLVARLDIALSDEVEGAGVALQGESSRAATLEILAERGLPSTMRQFVADAPVRYLASRSPEDVLAHAEMVDAVTTAAPSERLALGVRPGPTPDSFELTVIAHDRPELFSRIAGALSLAGLDILSADAFAAPDRLALDVFVVESSTLRPVEHETWTTFERLLRAALADRYELKTRLDERRRLYPSRTQTRTTVVVSPSEYDTAVRVTAPDRPGLLHDVSRAISSSGFDIRWARVITVEGTAIDTFHVVGSDGGPITDEGELGHMAMRLRAIG